MTFCLERADSIFVRGIVKNAFVCAYIYIYTYIHIYIHIYIYIYYLVECSALDVPAIDPSVRSLFRSFDLSSLSLVQRACFATYSIERDN